MSSSAQRANVSDQNQCNEEHELRNAYVLGAGLNDFTGANWAFSMYLTRFYSHVYVNDINKEYTPMGTMLTQFQDEWSRMGENYYRTDVGRGEATEAILFHSEVTTAPKNLDEKWMGYRAANVVLESDVPADLYVIAPSPDWFNTTSFFATIVSKLRSSDRVFIFTEITPAEYAMSTGIDMPAQERWPQIALAHQMFEQNFDSTQRYFSFGMGFTQYLCKMHIKLRPDGSPVVLPIASVTLMGFPKIHVYILQRTDGPDLGPITIDGFRDELQTSEAIVFRR